MKFLVLFAAQASSGCQTTLAGRALYLGTADFRHGSAARPEYFTYEDFALQAIAVAMILSAPALSAGR